MMDTMVKVAKGEGATISYGSDSYPYTVIDVSASGKQITLQADEYMITRGSHIEEQDCVFLPDPNGAIRTARWNDKRGRFMIGGAKGTPVSVGHRRYKRDPHF